jgi:hypothetical protein
MPIQLNLEQNRNTSKPEDAPEDYVARLLRRITSSTTLIQLGQNNLRI